MSDAPSVSVGDDGVVTYRASALGGCLNALVAARIGYEPVPPPKSMVEGPFAEGHALEEVAVRRVDFDVMDREREVELWVVPGKVRVVGHIDGTKIHADGSDGIVEIKSMVTDEWESWESRGGWDSGGLWDRYKWQRSVYSLALGRSVQLVRIERGKGDDGRISVEAPVGPCYTLEEIRARVLLVEAQARTGVMEQVSCDPKMYPCPFFYLHAEDDRVVSVDPEVETLIVEYDEASKDAKRADERKSRLKDALLRVAGKDRKLATERGDKVTFYDQDVEVEIKSSKQDPWKLVRTDENKVRVTRKKEQDERASE